MNGTSATPEERRTRKLARREKQRTANVGRAFKMRSARLAASPPDRIASDLLPASKVGCSGWFYWHWRETFYPPAMPTKDWFDFYTQNFATVELNAPFYSWPTINTVKTWVRQARMRNFICTLKVCELITHIKRFSRTQTLVKDFGFIADLLGKHIGCFLFQLPSSFHFTPARLKNILAQMDSARRNAVEFRHRSWWNPKVYAAFKKANVIFCSCSGSQLPDELVATTDEVYIRFHGLTKWYRHDYTPEELTVSHIARHVQRICYTRNGGGWKSLSSDRLFYCVVPLHRGARVPVI